MKKILFSFLTIIIIITVLVLSRLKVDQKQMVKLKPFEELLFMKNFPDFDKGTSTYMKNMSLESQKVALSRLKSQNDIPAWEIQGPFNIGGRINTIACNPDNPQVIYTGSVCGGIFKTIDSGQHWFPIFDDQSYLAISHIVISPQNDSIIYVGTGDPNIGGYAWVGNGVYRSIDAGKTWEHLGLENTGIISKIAINPQNPQIIYAAAMGIPFIRDNNRGLYKSTDGGQTWEQVLFLSNEAGVIDMVMVPDNPDTLIVAGWNRIRNYNESVTTGAECRLYRTFDGGTNWQPLTTDLPETPISRIGLAISTRDSLQILAQFVDGYSYETEGVYRSTSVGNHWAKLPSLGTEEGILGGFGWYFGKIRINPYNQNQVFILGVDLYRSDDAGITYQMGTPPWSTYEVHADKHDLIFIDSTTLLLSTDGGLYRSPDNGNTWFDIENIPNTQFYRVTVDPFHPDFYCGGAQDNGTSYGNIQDSANWLRLIGGDGFQPIFDWQNEDIMYGEMQNGTLCQRVRIDGELQWDYFDTSIDRTDRRSWDMPVCMSRKNSKHLYTGTYRVYAVFESQADAWTPISDDLTDGTNDRYHVITSIDVSPFTDSLLATGSSDGKVYVYDSVSWTDVSAGLPVRYVTRVKLSPNNRKHLFVTHSGYKANEYIPHIHFSANFGQTWDDISGNLPQLGINSIFVLNGYGDSVIFVATDGGIYHTLNLGQSWERTGAAMPVFPVYDLAYNDTNHVLVAGTFARSIMTLRLEDIVKRWEKPHSAISENKLDVNLFPNPAHSYIDLKSDQLPDKSEVIVTDMQGRNLYSTSTSGMDNIRIRLDGWEPGTYIVMIKRGDSVLVNRKFIKH